MTEAKRDRVLVTLSRALKQSPTPLSRDGEIHLAGKDISTIGTNIPLMKPEQVTKLYLSGNYISDLVGIEQLRGLRVLSLMNNSIRYLENLQPLGKLKCLETLSLDGNIVSRMPFYREHVISLCSMLQMLDSVKVTAPDRTRTKAIFHKIVAFYDKLKENELRNEVLAHTTKVVACHFQLKQAIFGRFRHLLRGHIGDSSGSSSGPASPGEVLRQALEGGVFCWLQRNDGPHLSRMVQNNLCNVLAWQQQQLRLRGQGHLHAAADPLTPEGDGARALLLGGPVGLGSEEDKALQGALQLYLDRQGELFLKLTRYCEHLLRESWAAGPAGPAGMGAADNEVVAQDQALLDRCIERVRLLAPGAALPSPAGAHCCADMLCLASQQQLRQEKRLHLSRRADRRSPLVSVANTSMASVSRTEVPRIAPKANTLSAGGLVRRVGVYPHGGGDAYIDKENAITARSTDPHFAPMPPPPPPAAAATPSVQTRDDRRAINTAYSPHFMHAPDPVREGVVRSDPSPGAAQAEVMRKSEVQERYAQLLAQHQVKKGEAVAPAAAGPISMNLPPQQREPGTPLRATGSVVTSSRYSSSSRHTNATPAPVDSMIDADSPDSLEAGVAAAPVEGEELVSQHISCILHEDMASQVDAFLQRAMKGHVEHVRGPEVGAEVGAEGEESSNTLPAELLEMSREMEARFLLAAQQIQEHVEESKEAQQLAAEVTARRAAPAAGTPGDVSGIAAFNAHQLRKEVHSLLARCSLLDVRERTARRLHWGLQTKAEQLLQSSATQAEDASTQLTARRLEVASVLQDARKGAVYVAVLQQELAKVQELQGRIQELREQASQLEQQEGAALSQIREQEALTAAVRSDLVQVTQALGIAQQDLGRNPAIVALARKDTIEAAAEAFWRRSKLRKGLLLSMLQRLRSRVRRQRRIRQFCVIRHRKAAVVLLKVVLLAWKGFCAVEARGRQLSRWRERRTRAAVLNAWLEGYAQQSYRVPVVAAKARASLLRHAFRAFRLSFQKRKHVALQTKQHALYATLFLSIRAFRAWKRLAVTARTGRLLAAAAVNTSRVQRTFEAWRTAAEARIRLLSARAQAVSLLKHGNDVRRALCYWKALFDFRRSLCQHRYKRRYFLRLLRRLAQRSSQRLQLCNQQAPDAVINLKGRRCLEQWRKVAHRRALLGKVAKAVKKDREGRLAATSWQTWRTAHIRSARLYRSAQLLRRRADKLLLARCVDAWWHLRNRTHTANAAQRTVDQVRERWLKLFDQPSQHKIEESVSTDRPDERASARSMARSHLTVQTRFRELVLAEGQLLHCESDTDSSAGGADSDGESSPAPRTRRSLLSLTSASVLAGRYWGKWRRRHRRLQQLRQQEWQVRQLCGARMTGRCLFAMAAMWSKTIINKRDNCLRDLAAIERKAQDSSTLQNEGHAAVGDQVVVRELEDSIARQHELSGFAKQQTDDLNLALAASAEDGRLRGAVLADVESSLAALAREQQAVRARTEEARRYAEGVRQRREAWVQRKEKPPLATESDSFGSGAAVRNLAELLERVTVSASTTVDHKHSAGAATEDGSMAGDHAALASLTTSEGGADERMLLLQDVETLYRQAVAAEEQRQRQQQHLGNQRAAAQALVAHRAQQEEQLDAQIAAMMEERARLEGALQACNDALVRAVREVDEQTRFHEETLRKLCAEEQQLRDALHELEHHQVRLEERLHREQQRRSGAEHKVREGEALQLARAAAASTDALLAAQAASAAAAGGGVRRGSAQPYRVEAKVEPTKKIQVPQAAISGHAATVSLADPPSVETVKVRSVPFVLSAKRDGTKSGPSLPSAAATRTRRGAVPAARNAPAISLDSSADAIDLEISALAARIRSRLSQS